MSRSIASTAAGFILLSLGITSATAEEAWAGRPLFIAAGGTETLSLPHAARPRPFIAGPPLTTEIEVARALLRSNDQGGGGDLLDLQALQTRYQDPTDGNVVLLIWTESIANPADISVFMDGNLLGAVPPVPADQVPAGNGVNITLVPAGPHLFRIETGGANAEVSQVVVASQPFADVTNLACQAAGPPDPATGNCRMAITWEAAGTLATTFLILINDIFQGDLPGTQREVTFTGVPPGSYCVNVVGILENADGRYRGGFSESCCEIACEDLPCDAPLDLLLCQIAYGSGNDNIVLAAWMNGEMPYPSGVLGTVDGAPVGTLPGDADLANFGALSPGEHTLGVQGDCGNDVLSVRTEDTITVLTSTPYTNPVNGPITCTFDPVAETTSATWTNADPAFLIAVYRDTPETDPELQGFIIGSSTTFELGNSTSATTILLQFFKTVDGDCYGSEIIGCSTPGKKYTQGVCNGVGNTPQITSAIFGLNFLFAGGPQPPCRKACDVDGNGSVDLTDMVRILNYLFAGGIPPSLWLDSDGDLKPDPTCTTAAPEDSCETGHEACAG